MPEPTTRTPNPLTEPKAPGTDKLGPHSLPSPRGAPSGKRPPGTLRQDSDSSRQLGHSGGQLPGWSRGAGRCEWRGPIPVFPLWAPRCLNSHSVDTPGPRGLAELKVSRDPRVVRSSKERNSSPSIPQRAGLPLEPWGRRPPAHTSHQAGTSAHPPHPGTPQAPHPQPVHTLRQGDQALRKQRPSASCHQEGDSKSRSPDGPQHSCERDALVLAEHRGKVSLGRVAGCPLESRDGWHVCSAVRLCGLSHQPKPRSVNPHRERGLLSQNTLQATDTSHPRSPPSRPLKARSRNSAARTGQWQALLQHRFGVLASARLFPPAGPQCRGDGGTARGGCGGPGGSGGAEGPRARTESSGACSGHASLGLRDALTLTRLATPAMTPTSAHPAGFLGGRAGAPRWQRPLSAHSRAGGWRWFAGGPPHPQACERL